MLLIVQMQKNVSKILSEQGIVEEHKKAEGESDQDSRYQEIEFKHQAEINEMKIQAAKDLSKTIRIYESKVQKLTTIIQN